MPQEKNYFVVTGAGLNLLANLQAGTTLKITRVVVGDGEIPDGTDPRTLTDLVHPIAQATSATPAVTDNRLNFDVEYRNDFGKFDSPAYWIADGYYDTTTGKLSVGFSLREYGVFALDAQGSEILLYYATIAAYPEAVYPYTVGNIQVKRYPVQIELMNDGIGVATEYDAGAFVTHEELDDAIDEEQERVDLLLAEESGRIDEHIANGDVHVTYDWKAIIGSAINEIIAFLDNPDIFVTAELKAQWAQAALDAAAALAKASSTIGDLTSLAGRVTQIEDSLINNLTANPFTVGFDSLADLLVTRGVYNPTLKRIEC